MIVNRHHHHQHAPTLARGAHARRRRRQQRARRDSVVMYGIGRIASQREREGGREGESRPHRAAGCLLRLLQGALQPLLRQRRRRATGINSVEAEPPAARTRAVRPRTGEIGELRYAGGQAQASRRRDQQADEARHSAGCTESGGGVIGADRRCRRGTARPPHMRDGIIMMVTVIQ
jgi:hypothetical protein